MYKITNKLDYNKSLTGAGNLKIGDFWSWAYSDILTNTNRAVFAEFIIGSALEVTGKPRIEWNEVDLEYRGKKIEVKSSAYLQSWEQKKLSTIRYDIKKTRSWNAKTNLYDSVPNRASDCYVFCLYSEIDPEKVNILDLNAWEFYTLSTKKIEQQLGTQKTLGLDRLQGLCEPIGYADVRKSIDEVLSIK